MTTRHGLALALWLAPAVAAAQATPVDLLHAVGTDVAVSSVYRSQRAQVDRLVDGDMETAWNSRTGDLVGAWIDVRLPADATVTGIGITPGFTHHTAERDLFTSNQRVARVHVTRDGTEVGSYALDTSQPVLVTIPVHGPGGVYRIEITEMLVGSRADWRETCISELRVLGTAPSMTPGERLPRTAVGALPAVQTLAADSVATERAQRREVGWLTTAWNDLQVLFDRLQENTGGIEHDDLDARDFAQSRRAMLLRVCTLVAPIDPVRADALRVAAGHAYDWTSWSDLRLALDEAIERIASALDAVTTFLHGDEATCRSERAIAGIRLRRIASAAHQGAYAAEVDYDQVGPPAHGIDEDDAWLAAAIEEWSRNSRGVATRLSRRRVPADPIAAAEWPALMQRLRTAQTACGWASP